MAVQGRYRTLYDKQYRLEADRFINPGEDFTPDLPGVKVPAGVRGNDAL
jgi:subfamily B ATP-binding cassette protein MsbA